MPKESSGMSTRIELTLACGDYEIMRALKEGTVRPDGIDLKVVTAMDSPTRHWRFLRGREFDVAEVSCSSYIAARDNGVPFKSMDWYTELDEDIAEAAFPKDLRLSRVPPSKSIIGMLLDGELDAI